ncbi:MAG TPA: CPBP family intramembrane glutamic endopeptidase [Patescibacteria group bacterium]|nr:CPBP family intramembrane glutamic endopeptidase [Patescibacteria group bacterium]
MKKYLIILLFSIFPFLLIKDLPLMWVRYFFVTIFVIFLFYQTFTKYNFKQLGYFKPTKQDYLFFLPMIPFSFLLLMLFIRFKLSYFCPPEPLTILEKIPTWLYLLIYALINTPVQEVIYRPFLINHLEMVLKNKKLIFILSVTLFSLLHLAWGAQLVLGSFFFGIYVVWWFMKTRNVVFITIAHILIGLIIMYFCFI